MSYYVKLGDEWVAINGRIYGREQSRPYIRYCNGVCRLLDHDFKVGTRV